MSEARKFPPHVYVRSSTELEALEGLFIAKIKPNEWFNTEYISVAERDYDVLIAKAEAYEDLAVNMDDSIKMRDSNILRMLWTERSFDPEKLINIIRKEALALRAKAVEEK